MLECEIEGKTTEIEKLIEKLRECQLKQQMGEVERSEYQAIIND